VEGEGQQSEAFLGSEKTLGKILEEYEATGVILLQNIEQE